MPGTIPLMLPPGKHSSDLGGLGCRVSTISLFLTHTHVDAHSFSLTHIHIFTLFLSETHSWTQNAFCLCLDIQWPLSLPYNNYRNKLTDEKLIRVSGIAKVEETGRSMLVLKDISLEPPHLSIEVRHLGRAGAGGVPSDSANPAAGGTAANKTQSPSWTPNG